AFKQLVSTAELAAHLDRWRVFDCRHDLAKPQLGGEQYGEAHIPGALFASLDRDLSALKTGSNGRHPLPDPDAFADWLSRRAAHALGGGRNGPPQEPGGSRGGAVASTRTTGAAKGSSSPPTSSRGASSACSAIVRRARW